MQAVGDDEAVERHRLAFMPLPHHLESRENADMAQFGDLVQQLDHLAGAFRLGVHRRRILRIDQHQVSAGRLDLADAVLDDLGGIAGVEVAQHRIGTDLPDHQIGLRVDHLVLQPGHHLRRVLAALAAVEHGDAGTGIGPMQLRRQPVRIGEFRRRRAVAFRRRRSEGHDHNRFASCQLGRHMRQRAHRLAAAFRRQAGHAGENVAGGFRDFLDLVDGLAGEALLVGGGIGHGSAGRCADTHRVSGLRMQASRQQRKGKHGCNDSQDRKARKRRLETH